MLIDSFAVKSAKSGTIVEFELTDFNWRLISKISVLLGAMWKEKLFFGYPNCWCDATVTMWLL